MHRGIYCAYSTPLEKHTLARHLVGFFVLQKQVTDRIEGDHTSWESTPLGSLAADGQLHAYHHRGFWQPMDTLRDKQVLERLWESGKAPWKLWNGPQ